jgi:hypothetical protein
MESSPRSVELARRARSRKRAVVGASEALPASPMTIGEFHKALDRLSPSHTRYENFRNFMQAAYAALARRTALSRARSDALEEHYPAVMRRYAREPQAHTADGRAFWAHALDPLAGLGRFSGRGVHECGVW